MTGQQVRRPGPTAGTLVVARVELAKLTAQRRVRLAFGACAAVPFLLVLVLRVQSGVPEDTLFGRWVQESGFAVALVVLGFAGTWLLPLLGALVAGDVFAAEDRNGMWPLLLTRSRSRAELFLGKALVAAGCSVALVLLLGLSSLAAGLLLVGSQPLVGLSGQLLPPGRCLLLVLASWLSVLPPVLTFTALALLLSVRARSAAVGVAVPVVVGLLLQLLALVQGADVLRHLLPSTAFESWHGLFAAPEFRGPLLQGVLVSATAGAALLGAAWLVFASRDDRG